MSKNHNKHKGYKYRRWQKQVFERDSYTCVLCGSKYDLTTDHIKPLVSYPESAYDVNNGRTLCDGCRVKEMLNDLSNGKYRPKKNKILAEVI